MSISWHALIVTLILIIIFTSGSIFFKFSQSEIDQNQETISKSQIPIQIISVKTIPTNPKVGDNIQINFKIQNKASYPIYYGFGNTCLSPPFDVSFHPVDMFKVQGYSCACAIPGPVQKLNPNETINGAAPQSCFGGDWTLLKLGIITATSTFVWGTTSQNPQANHTSILSTFNLASSSIFESPLKQIAKGILAENVKCSDGLILIKRNTNSIACVKPQTAQKLVERGWGITIESFHSSLIDALTLTTDKGFYEKGEKIEVVITNTSNKTLIFPDGVFGINIRNSDKDIPVCCASTANITEIKPKMSHVFEWDQSNFTDGSQVKLGNYTISVTYGLPSLGMDGKKSTSIEIK